MTSKNSFWGSCRENHKRRIWVWIVAVLLQLLEYGGITMIYLSRIKSFYGEGVYRTYEEFQEAMYQAAKDALGFSDNLFPAALFLAAVIAMQGFSYLYDKRKVDMYHSVPVSKNRRFAVVYVNGLVIWLTANLSGLFLGTVIAASQHAMNADVAAAAGLAFVWNLFFFLVFYHVMILAVMLTGNRFVTVCLFLAFTLYESGVFNLVEGMKTAFFRTYSWMYISREPKLSVLYDYMANVRLIKIMPDAASMARAAMPYVGKWILIAAVLFALSYVSYTRRPSETAGKAITWNWLKPVLKVVCVIPVALLIGMAVYDTSYSNELLQVVGMLAGGVILCAALEVLYDFDIRSIFKHLLSSGVTLLGILAVFCIFKWDLFGYDKYIPAQNKVESIAISVDGYYDTYWDYDYENDNGRYMGSGEFKEQNMFLTDVEPVLELVENWQQEKPEVGCGVQILYRLKSGARKERAIQIDLDDPATEEFLNRIFQMDAFKTGTFQVMADERTAEDVKQISYTNGAAKVAVPVEAASKLRDAWIQDMEQFDFSLVRHSRPSGSFTFQYAKSYVDRQFFVYDCFENTIACLKEQNAWYPMTLDAADIDSVTVTCYHNELVETDPPQYAGVEARAMEVDTYVDYSVQETFYDEAEIAQILPHLYSNWLDVPWGNYGDLDDNYSVQVIFKRDSAYPYDRTSYYFPYEFFAGQVPDFVAEATAYTGEAEEKSHTSPAADTVLR